jgi:hypothetical protein
MIFNRSHELAEIDRDSWAQQTPFLTGEKDVKSKVLPKSCLDRHSFIGGSNPRVFMPEGGRSLLLLWRERRGAPQPEDLESRPSQPARAKRSPSSVCTAHTEFVAALAGQPPRPIPLEADAIDLEDRADHLDRVFDALSVYVTVILDDTAQNVPGSLDLRDAEGVLADLASDVTGAIQKAADEMAGRPA